MDYVCSGRRCELGTQVVDGVGGGWGARGGGRENRGAVEESPGSEGRSRGEQEGGRKGGERPPQGWRPVVYTWYFAKSTRKILAKEPSLEDRAPSVRSRGDVSLYLWKNRSIFRRFFDFEVF